MLGNSDHLKRVVPEHRKPRFMKWLETNLIPIDDIMNTIYETDHAYDLDYAIGVQLDVTGDIVGIKRLLGFEPPLGISPLLEDDVYRILQQAKISLNQWDGTIPAANALLEGMLPKYKFLLYDNQNMTISVYITGEPSILEREIISRGYITPKPEGVRLNYEFILPALSFEDTLYIGGTVSTDAAWIDIPHRTLENMSFKNEIGVKGIISADIMRESVHTRTLNNMTLMASEKYTSVCFDVGYIFLPTAELRQGGE